MLAKSCMTAQVELGHPEMKIFEAAEKMRNSAIGILPIEDNDRLVGMISDRDIVIRVVAEGKDPKTTSVGDVMTKNIRYCYEDQSLEEITRNLGENQIRRLPVLSREKRLVGILSITDLVQTDVSLAHAKNALNHIARVKVQESEFGAQS